MSSKPHKIFGPYSSRVGGLEPVTGRNAQFPTMARKQEYAEINAPERPYISPFSGYASNSETTLSTSYPSPHSGKLSNSTPNSPANLCASNWRNNSNKSLFEMMSAF